jgi:hypothetical protein
MKSQLVERERKGVLQGQEDWCIRSSFNKSSSAKSEQGQ